MEAVIRIDHMRESLCERCLGASMKKRVWGVLDAKVEDGDRITVALSGGKDSSLALTYLIDYRQESGRDFGVFSITIDEGSDYRERALVKARELTSLLGVEHRVVEFKEMFGASVPEIRLALPPNSRRSACTYCGVFRRQGLNIVARQLGATKMVTGHNLDDLAQTLLMNLIRGDMSAMVRLFSESPPSSKLVPRIKPLMFVSEREAAVQAYLLGIPAHFGKCPTVLGMRVHVRRILNEVALRIPEFKPSLAEGLARLLEKSKEGLSLGFALRSCDVCGEPTTGEICKVCEFKRELEAYQERTGN